MNYRRAGGKERRLFAQSLTPQLARFRACEGYGPHPEELAKQASRRMEATFGLAAILRDARKGALVQRRAQLRSRGDEVGDIFTTSFAGDDRLGLLSPAKGAAASSPRRETQHPLQMLITLRSSSLPCSLTVARVAARRDLDAANRVRFILTALCTGNVR